MDFCILVWSSSLTGRYEVSRLLERQWVELHSKRGWEKERTHCQPVSKLDSVGHQSSKLLSNLKWQKHEVGPQTLRAQKPALGWPPEATVLSANQTGRDWFGKVRGGHGAALALTHLLGSLGGLCPLRQ